MIGLQFRRSADHASAAPGRHLRSGSILGRKGRQILKFKGYTAVFCRVVDNKTWDQKRGETRPDCITKCPSSRGSFSHVAGASSPGRFFPRPMQQRLLVIRTVSYTPNLISIFTFRSRTARRTSARYSLAPILQTGENRLSLFLSDIRKSIRL